jgi:anti-anti-sigma factor
MTTASRFNTRSSPEESSLAEVLRVGEFPVEDTDGTKVLKATVDVDISNADRLRRIAEPILRDERLVIDLRGCEYIDSTGVQALWMLSRAHEGRLKIVVGRESKIRAIFVIGAMMNILPIADTVEDAIQS